MIISAEEAFEKLKDILSKELENDKNGKIFDRHIADVLDMSVRKMRHFIYREEIPIQEITLFLLKRNIDVNQFFATQFKADDICKK